MAEQRWLPVIAAVFVTSLVVSNIIAVKLIAVGPFFLTAAILIFPVSYIFGDILTEVYGYAQARRVIWIGFGCNLMAVFIFYLSIELPAAPSGERAPLNPPPPRSRLTRRSSGRRRGSWPPLFWPIWSGSF